jgi:phage host-nuclease inhibitor protein Gam
MGATRRKAVRQQAPQTLEEAIGELAEYADILTGIEELEADAVASIAAIKAERDRMVAPLEQRLKEIFLRLRAWWAVAGAELTEGKRKSHELAGCVLGERTTPPSLKMPAKAEEAALLLVNVGLAELCRHKVEVDKPAVLKTLARWEELQEKANLASVSGPEAWRHLIDTVDDEELIALAKQILPIVTLRDLGFTAVQKEEFFIDRAGEKPAAVEIVQEAAE